MSRLRSALSLAALVTFVLVGAVAPAASAAPDPLAKVSVSGEFGQQPSIEFTPPFAVKRSVADPVIVGTGDELTKGDKITFDYFVVDGRTGKEVKSYGDAPASITLDPKQAKPGLVDGLIGTHVGGRTLLAIAPREGIAAQLGASGVDKNDTLLFVVDVTSVRVPLVKATGTPVAPVAGLPTVRVAKRGTPTITVPKTAPPTQLVVQPLVQGTGPVVQSGQTVTVHYVGALWRNGKVFDSSWKRSAPLDTAIGTGQVIAGWDQGLVGQTVGSQVLLVVPPDQGYGAAGSPPAITGTDTLVFVVDILDAS